MLAELATKPVPAAELAKAKSQLHADFVRGLKTVSGKANQLGFFEVVFGDYRELFGLVDAWEAVTADDVQRVAGALPHAERGARWSCSSRSRPGKAAK